MTGQFPTKRGQWNLSLPQDLKLCCDWMVNWVYSFAWYQWFIVEEKKQECDHTQSLHHFSTIEFPRCTTDPWFNLWGCSGVIIITGVRQACIFKTLPCYSLHLLETFCSVFFLRHLAKPRGLMLFFQFLLHPTPPGTRIQHLMKTPFQMWISQWTNRCHHYVPFCK